MTDKIVKLNDGSLMLYVDKKIYNHEAILAAAYRQSASCFMKVTMHDDQHFGVHFTAKLSETDLRGEIDIFCNELIDQQIRFNLNRDNHQIKEMIIKKAFSPFNEDHD